jgi:hypothetical protein
MRFKQSENKESTIYIYIYINLSHIIEVEC